MTERTRAGGWAAPTLLSLEGVAAGRDRARLEAVDWRLKRGEVWAVVGPNGAGKSTLLRVLRGQVPVIRGELRYGSNEAGRALAAEPWRQVLHVSFAAQSTLLKGAAGYVQSRWHGGEDDAVARARDVLGTALDLPEGRRIVGALALEPILDRRVTELSNGERRKVLIARAAATGPIVLALDNPFAGLDRASRAVVADAVRRLHERGMTILLATSRTDEMPEVTTHILVLESGRVVRAGPRDTVEGDERFAEVMLPAARRPERAPARPGAGSATSSSGRTPLVELREVDVRYGAVDVLRRIDWTVRRGERWVVVGANGAGKSALLSLVLTDNPQAYANDVSLFGRRRGSGESIWDLRRRIGCVSPEMHLYCERDRRVLDVVRSGFRSPVVPPGRPVVREVGVAEAWLEALGLEQCRDRRFGDLSEGERQMVLIGRALATGPELLVLDEPCQGLDPGRRARVLDVLERTLRPADTTLILVTHDVDEIPSSMTHGLLLRRGRAALAASVDEVLEAYAEEGAGPPVPPPSRSAGDAR